MSRRQFNAGLVFMGLLLALYLGVSCTTARDFDDRLSPITRPYSFSIAKWELQTLFDKANNAISDRDGKTDNGVNKVLDYFASVQRVRSLESAIEAMAGSKQGDPAPLKAELDRLEQQNSASRGTVAEIIEQEIRDTLAGQGIFNPVDNYIRLKITFPRINFEIEPPPHLLVISPRDRIEQSRGVMLQPDMTTEEIESLEARVDKLGVSSLVVELGGFAGSYPTFITDQADLRFTIDTAAHEWLHQYLAFQPLGFAYLLDVTGISPNYVIATINETVASMFGKEIASAVLEKYYGQHEDIQGRPPAAESEFNREMRETRRAVDQYLAKGEIEEAEKFMEQRRQYLASQGYYIRKLNQAYFAFYGTYADSPTSISPIGSELMTLRSQRKSLRDFLDTVAAMTSQQDLTESLK